MLSAIAGCRAPFILRGGGVIQHSGTSQPKGGSALVTSNSSLNRNGPDLLIRRQPKYGFLDPVL
jgi:hypothetical protein